MLITEREKETRKENAAMREKPLNNKKSSVKSLVLYLTKEER